MRFKQNVMSNCASAVGVGHARPLPGSRTAPCASNNDAMFRSLVDGGATLRHGNRASAN
jgi:hypothetical protein